MHPMTTPRVPPTAVPSDAVLLDVREMDEWVVGHAPSAVHLPMSEIAQRVGEVPPGEVYVICRVGSRSAQVAHWLNGQGWQASNVDGGMQSWQAQGLPMVSETGAPPRVL